MASPMDLQIPAISDTEALLAYAADTTNTAYPVPLSVGPATQIGTSLVITVPPSTRPITLMGGAHYLCTTAGAGLIYLGIADISGGTPKEVAANYISDTFVATGFLSIIGSLRLGCTLLGSEDWREFCLMSSVYRDSGTFAASMAASGAAGTFAMAGSKAPFVMASLA